MMLYEVTLFGIALNCCNDWPMWGICPNFASDMQEREKKIYRVTLVGSVVNALLVVFKFIAGFLGQSSAMVADAVHSLSDFLSDIVVVCFVRISGKPEDEDHDYGHGKYETLAAILVGVMLFAVGLGLLYNGLSDTIGFFRGRELPEPTMLALIAALVSIVSKEALFQYTIRANRTIDSPALVANAWHHRSDALTSVATLIGISGAMFLGARWRVLDPLAAVVVSGFILKTAWDLSRPGINELLEKSLPEEEKHEIVEIVLTTPEVSAMHRLRTRRIGMNRAIEFHVKMDGGMTLAHAHEIASEIERHLRARFGAGTIINIHMEPAAPLPYEIPDAKTSIHHNQDKK